MAGSSTQFIKQPVEDQFDGSQPEEIIVGIEGRPIEQGET